MMLPKAHHVQLRDWMHSYTEFLFFKDRDELTALIMGKIVTKFDFCGSVVLIRAIPYEGMRGTQEDSHIHNVFQLRTAEWTVQIPMDSTEAKRKVDPDGMTHESNYRHNERLDDNSHSTISGDVAAFERDMILMKMVADD